MEQMQDYIYLDQNVLNMHPDNMRSYIDPEDAAQMGKSIMEYGGVIQALIVVEDPKRPGRYLVCDGNMRLAGARTLGNDCPKLKCEKIEAEASQQRFIMGVTSVQHYPKRPVDLARHYKRLSDEGFSHLDIAKAHGLASTATIAHHLKLLGLAPEVQQAVNRKDIPKDITAITALLNLPDEEQTKLVQAFVKAGKKPTTKMIQTAVAKVAATRGESVKVDEKTVIPVKLFTKMMGAMVALIRNDADLFDEAAIALENTDDELAFRLITRAEKLRRQAKTATRGKYD